MRALWRFVRIKRNRESLGWLGAGAVVVIGGLWAVFVYVFPAGRPGTPPAPGIEVRQGVAAGRDLTGNTITIAPAPEPAPPK